MKLLLTSGGITNKSIENALLDLVGKKFENTSVVYVPTASNTEKGDKRWLIKNLEKLNQLGFKQIDIADISAVNEMVWRPKFEEADVLFFEGGNPYYLMEWIDKSGLVGILPDLLKTRVYVGTSAGSMVTNPDLALKLSQEFYGEDLEKVEDVPGLKYVAFNILPHLNSPYFPKLNKGNIKDSVVKMNTKVYALDDQSALKINDGEVEVVSEGEYLEFN